MAAAGVLEVGSCRDRASPHVLSQLCTQFWPLALQVRLCLVPAGLARAEVGWRHMQGWRCHIGESEVHRAPIHPRFFSATRSIHSKSQSSTPAATTTLAFFAPQSWRPHIRHWNSRLALVERAAFAFSLLDTTRSASTEALRGLFIMASQQQQIIDTIFSMKRKLLRKDDRKTPQVPLLRLG